jgi:hypothetical protein
MLSPSRMTPTVSAYTYLWGQHDYNANPYAPLGCKVEAHVVPSIRETWAPHTTSGYFIGNSPDPYCSHEVYITDTCHTRTCSTVLFRHKYLTLPNLPQSDALICATYQLTDAIAGIAAPPNVTHDAIDQLIAIFKNKAATAKETSATQRVARPSEPDQRVTQQHKENKANIDAMPPLLVVNSEWNYGEFRRISDSRPFFDPISSDSDSGSERKRRFCHVCSFFIC